MSDNSRRWQVSICDSEWDDIHEKLGDKDSVMYAFWNKKLVKLYRKEIDNKVELCVFDKGIEKIIVRGSEEFSSKNLNIANAKSAVGISMIELMKLGFSYDDASTVTAHLFPRKYD